jgi:4-oxalomesaconate tautomerase
MSEGVRVMWMRGGTSKGAFFLAEDLPADVAERDRFLLRVMGSPDPRQIDGMGGANPLTSKVAVVKRSERTGVDVDYLFLQVFIDQAIVTDAQNCGNILAGVGPFAIERELVTAADGETPVAIYMQNTDQVARAVVQTPGGKVTYEGQASIDGVPGRAAPVPLVFSDTAGSMTGALLPTGRAIDEIDGVPVTLIDNGMPCVVLKAADVGVAGTEDCATLEADSALRERIEALRLKAGPLMNLGDVREKSVPKMILVSPPKNGGSINTRSFIPHRCHDSIGVLAAVTVATAGLLPGSPAQQVSQRLARAPRMTIVVEHPSGRTECVVEVGADGGVDSAGMLRTARKLMDGLVFA